MFSCVLFTTSRWFCTTNPLTKSQLCAAFPPHGNHLHPDAEGCSQHLKSEVREAKTQLKSLQSSPPKNSSDGGKKGKKKDAGKIVPHVQRWMKQSVYVAFIELYYFLPSYQMNNELLLIIYGFEDGQNALNSSGASSPWPRGSRPGCRLLRRVISWIQYENCSSDEITFSQQSTDLWWPWWRGTCVQTEAQSRSLTFIARKQAAPCKYPQASRFTKNKTKHTYLLKLPNKMFHS